MHEPVSIFFITFCGKYKEWGHIKESHALVRHEAWIHHGHGCLKPNYADVGKWTNLTNLRLRFIDGFQLQVTAWNKKGVQEVQRRHVLSWYYTVKNVTSLVHFCHIMLASMWNRQPFAVSAERKPDSWVEINLWFCWKSTCSCGQVHARGIYQTGSTLELLRDPSAKKIKNKYSQGFACLFSQWGLKTGSRVTWLD